MGHDDVEVTVVTPERAPLSLFGDEASEAVAEELRNAGVELETGAVARRDGDGLVLEPGGERLDVQRVFAVPRHPRPGARRARRPTRKASSSPATTARVEGCERTWAAGDGVVSPLKFGGLATHQARLRRGGDRARSRASRTCPIPASRCSTAGCSSATARAGCAAAATPRARRCGGRRARSRASTCRAGWPSTA